MAGISSMPSMCRHRHGLTAGGPFEEVAVEAKAGVAALLRVELGGDDVVAGKGAGEGDAVVGLADNAFAVVGRRVVAVDEVEVGVVRYAVEDGVRPASSHLVPAHVRHFQAVGQSQDAAGKDVEAGVLAALLADGQERLEAHADAEVGPAARHEGADGLDEGALAQVAHGVGGGADAGHDDDVRGLDGGGVAGDGGVVAAVGDGALDAAQVAGAVVDDDDSHGSASGSILA